MTDSRIATRWGLVDWLRRMANESGGAEVEARLLEAADKLELAQALLNRAKERGELSEAERASLVASSENTRAWVPVSERMPKSGAFVLAFVHEGERTRRIRAFYAEKGTIDCGSDDGGDWSEYDEIKDEYFLPAGWYEANEFEETHWHVTDPVTHWMPLPEGPK